jgi:hypothetical protein
MSALVSELRTDFTADTSDLTRGADDAAGALGAVGDELGDLRRQAGLTDDDLAAMADGLADAARRASGAEDRLRDMRKEIARLRDQEVHVDVDVDRDGAGRGALKGLTGALTGVTGALGGALSSLPAVGSAFAALGPAALPAAAAILAVTFALGGLLVGLIPLAAGFALFAGGTALMYSRSESLRGALEPLVRTLKTVGSTLLSILAPAFTQAWQIIGESFRGPLLRLNESLTTNRDAIQRTVLMVARWATQAVAFGASVTIAVLQATPPVLRAFASWARGAADFFHLLYAGFDGFVGVLGRFIPGMDKARAALKSAEGAALKGAAGLDEMAGEAESMNRVAVPALEDIRDGAHSAADRLGTAADQAALLGRRIDGLQNKTVTVTYREKYEALPKWKRDQIAGVNQGWGGRSAPTGGREARAGGTVINLSVPSLGLMQSPAQVGASIVDALAAYERGSGRQVLTRTQAG